MYAINSHGEEAAPVVDLRYQRKRRGRADPPEAAQPARGLGIGLLLGEGFELRIERSESALQLLEGQQVIVEDRLVGRVFEATAPRPRYACVQA